MKKLRIIIGVALLAVAAVLAYFHFSAKDRVDEEIKKALASLPAGWSIEYKSLDYAISSDLLILEGVKVTAPATPPLTVSFDKLEVGGITLTTVKDLVKGVDNATAFLPLAKKISLQNLSIEMPGKFTSVSKRYEATNVAIKPWPRLSGSLTSDQIVTLLRSYSIEKEELTEMKGDVYLFKDLKPFNIEIAKVTTSNLGDGKIDQLEMTGLKSMGEAPSDLPNRKTMQVNMGIGLMTASKVDYTAALPALAEGNFRQYAMRGTTYESAMYKDITYDIDGVMSLAAKEMGVKDTAFDKGVPTKATFTMQGMTFVLKDTNAKMMWSDLGYDAPPSFSGEGAYVYNSADKRMELNDFRLGSDNVANLVMTFKIAGIDPYEMNSAIMEQPENSDMIMQKAVDSMDLISMKVHYEDKSLVGRIFEATAQKNGQTAEEAQQEAIMGVSFLGGMLAKDSPELSALFESIVQFLEKPGSITLSLNPKSPVPMGERGGQVFAGKEPAEILQILGLELVVNK